MPSPFAVSLIAPNHIVSKNEIKPMNKEQLTVRKGVRSNGFQWPLHPQQLLSWLVFFFNFGLYFVVDVISLSSSKGLSVFLSILYSIISYIVLFLAIKTTKSDPSDPTIKLQR